MVGFHFLHTTTDYTEFDKCVNNGQKLKVFSLRCQNTRTYMLKQQRYHIETRIVREIDKDGH